jgi:hypothetical protein
MNDNETNPLNPTAENDLSDYENRVAREAQTVGSSPQGTGAAGSTSGVSEKESSRGEGTLGTAAARAGTLNRTTIPGEAFAAEPDEPGGDADISGGVANLDESAGTIADQNEYNK